MKDVNHNVAAGGEPPRLGLLLSIFPSVYTRNSNCRWTSILIVA